MKKGITLSDVGGLMLWRYYFLDLPRWACGVRTPGLWKNLPGIFGNEISLIRDGLITLFSFCGKRPEDIDIEASLDKALRIKLVRESDGYCALRMTKKNLDKYFQIDGMENISSSLHTNRPVVLLTGHIGSFFVPLVAFSHLGVPVYPIAGKVNHPVLATRLFLSWYRSLIRRCFDTQFIYTDMKGKIDRSIVSVLNSKGILWAAIDLPKSLSPVKRIPVKFLGRTSSLPSGLIAWGLKKKAVFLTAWNTVETEDNIHFVRKLRIDAPINAGPDADAHDILQIYADRLSDLLCREPWQWMQLNIIREYDEQSLSVETD